MGGNGYQVAFLIESDIDLYPCYCGIVRLLMSLSGFPSSRYLECEYVAMNGYDPTLRKIPTVELTSSSLEKFLNTVANTTVHSQPMASLSSVLARVVQSSSWDAPSILSPPRKQKFCPEAAELHKFVFVCSNKSGLGGIISSDLQSFLVRKRICVFRLNCKVYTLLYFIGTNSFYILTFSRGLKGFFLLRGKKHYCFPSCKLYLKL